MAVGVCSFPTQRAHRIGLSSVSSPYVDSTDGRARGRNALPHDRQSKLCGPVERHRQAISHHNERPRPYQLRHYSS